MKKLKKYLIGFFILAFGVTSFAEDRNTKSLSKKQQEIILISAFTADGNLKELETALNNGLEAGLTVNEIKDILVQLYAYCGFPRSLNGLNTFIKVLDNRKNAGINDNLGRESSPVPADRNVIEFGTQVQTQLSGAEVKGAVYSFAPAIDKYLKAHLFGDIFGSDVIDFQTRELVTVAALANMNGVNPQLQAHFKNGMNSGLTENQMRELISVFRENVGEKQAKNAEVVLNTYLKNR